MANETQFLIKGNFLIVKNITTNDEYIRAQISSVKFTRTKNDEFIFFNATPLQNEYNSQQLNVLGINRVEGDRGVLNESRSLFTFSDCVDSDGLPFSSADTFDSWLCTNLGKYPISGGSVNSVTGLDTDNTDPSNPIVKISVDSITITGSGTPDDPLSVVPRSPSIGNYAQTVQGPTINTGGEQSIIGSGVGSLSIPANGFVVGDSFHGKLGGLINATGGGGRSEIIINVRSNGTVLATTGSFDLDNATNQGWEMELDFTIRSIGTTGIISTNGNFVYTKDNNRAVFGYIFQDNKAIDTTVNNTLDVTVEWRVLNSGDDIYSANFVLYKVY